MSQFKEISERPPSDFSLDTEIDYCMASVEKARILADCIVGEERLIALYKKDCFSKTMEPKKPAGSRFQ